MDATRRTSPKLVPQEHFSFVHHLVSFGENSLSSNSHCPGALLVSILTSNKTWRTRNAVGSSNAEYGKTTQHFAMMSASDFFHWVYVVTDG